MGVEETAFKLIGLAYDAALAPQKWPAFMERAARAMGAQSALLREVDYNAGHVGIFETVGFDPTFVAAYREHFVHLDYFAPALLSLPVGAVMRGDEAVPWERQRMSEFYNDYQRRLKNRHVMGTTLARYERYHLLFALQRELRQPDYDEEDMRLVGLVAPHMARAAQIHHQLTEVTAQKHWALAALDRLRVGVILLDELGRPVHLNRAAERLVREHNAFTAGRNRLTLSTTTDTDRLKRLIVGAAALATGRKTGQEMAAAGSLRVRAEASSGVALQFQVIPLPRDRSERPWEDAQYHGCVAVFVSASGGAHLPWDRIAAMHGLTRAEAKLAALLAKGISLEEAAATLLVSILTVRSQLKSVFAKTGVTRQAELVALLLADMLTDQTNDPS